MGAVREKVKLIVFIVGRNKNNGKEDMRSPLPVRHCHLFITTTCSGLQEDRDADYVHHTSLVLPTTRPTVETAFGLDSRNRGLFGETEKFWTLVSSSWRWERT